MRKRFTCIAMFDEESLEKISKAPLNIKNKDLCKVPYLKEPYTLENREIVDTLPYHFTLSYWDEDYKAQALNVFNTISIHKIELSVESIKIKEGNDNSYNLYFSFSVSDRLKDIQQQIYNITKNEKFNPNTYLLHISIHSDKDYEKIKEMKDILMKNFEKFTVSFDKLGLFEIYPAKRIL